jgi:hypothetical protein
MKYLVGIAAFVTALFPYSAAAQSADAVTPLANTTVAGSYIVSTKRINVVRIGVTSGASAGYLMVFNATTVPADGTVTPVFCRPVAANAYVNYDLEDGARFSTGLVLVFSTTGCFSKTISNTAFFEVSVR